MGAKQNASHFLFLGLDLKHKGGYILENKEIKNIKST